MLHLLFLLLSSLIQLGRTDTLLLKTNQGSHFIGTTQNSSNSRPPGFHQKSGKDYQEGGWLNECSLEGSGKMVQHDIPSQGGSIHMRCSGGCLNILKVLYACKKAPTKPAHLKAVQKLCQGKEECNVKPGTKLFGRVTCRESTKRPLMWIVYSCVGGEDETTTIIPNGGSTGRPGNEGKCLDQPEGPMKQEDIPGIVGWVYLRCPGGCLTIHKVLYACEAEPEPDKVQKEIVQKLCQGKESCLIQPGLKVFDKDVVCPGKTFPLMWLVYSCDGKGKDETEIFTPDDPKCHKSYKCTKESTCKHRAGTCR